MKNQLTLEQLALLTDDRKPKVNFLIPDGKQFAKHYAQNRENIVKLQGWGMYAEGGLPLTDKPYTVGFCQFGKQDPAAAPDGLLSIPYETLSQLGFKLGDRIDRLVIYAEIANPRTINCYVSKKHFKHLSKRKIREIEKEIDGILPDCILGED